MRILITAGIYPPDIGGPATMLEALAGSLREEGFEIKILTFSERPLSDEENVFRIKKNRHFLYFLSMLRLSFWAGALYVTDTYSVGYFAYLIKKFTGKKYIVRFAGDSAWETSWLNGWTKDNIVDFEEKIQNTMAEKLKRRRKKIMAGADRIIAVSNFLKGLAEKIGVDPEKIRVIYNSVDFKKEAIAAKVGLREKLGQDTKIMITACRLVPWKGIEELIRIIPGLSVKFKNLAFVILGDGPDEERLKKIASGLGVSDKVYFWGRVDSREVIDYFKEADIFVLNTNYEGLSHTILEAMQAGTPVVATNVGGNPETIEDGETGLLVEYNNGEKIAKAAEKILSDKDFAENLSRNAKTSLKKFNWDNLIKQTVETIKEVVYEK